MYFVSLETKNLMDVQQTSRPGQVEDTRTSGYLSGKGQGEKPGNLEELFIHKGPRVD